MYGKSIRTAIMTWEIIAKYFYENNGELISLDKLEKEMLNKLT